jgi:hypothetical protein
MFDLRKLVRRVLHENPTVTDEDQLTTLICNEIPPSQREEALHQAVRGFMGKMIDEGGFGPH